MVNSIQRLRWAIYDLWGNEVNCVLKKLRLKNYRCFEDSEISFRNTSIIVGQNNAGKSTVIEALRILAAVTQKGTPENFV